MRLVRRSRLLLAPVVLVTAGACFATRADLRIVQGDVLAVRDSVRAARLAAERRDSLARVATDSALARVVAALVTVGDSVVSIRGATQRMDGALREDLHTIRQQLITIQELTGQSQRRIQELRADLESDAADRASTPVVPSAAADTTRGTTTVGAAGGAGTPTGPGPAQLYQLGQDQLRRGSNTAARGAFTTLLTQHPQSDLAPDALYGIAETFTAEGNGVRADSVYNLVATRYPQSERAPIALYKRATAYRLVGQAERAQSLYRQIVETYPNSESARLAQGFLTSRRP
ncbi:MAG: tetratricopeptide repeat protein [Gemmatimonadetes bacterium]|nr:tetratricopeptide repeat protein [Gemmatimonadota bacterium]